MTVLRWPFCILALLLFGGCTSYLPLDTISLVDGATYRIGITRNEQDEFQSIVTRQTATCEQTQVIHGFRADCLAVSANGDFLALGADRLRVSGRYYNDSSVLLLNASTLEMLAQWTIPGVRGAGGYPEAVTRFDAIAISPDGQTVATYYWKPPGWKPVVALWGARTGELLKEFDSPEPSGPAQSTIYSTWANSLTFSADGGQLAAARMTASKRSEDGPAVGVIHIWRIEDSRRTDLPLAPNQVAWDLCFSESGTGLAYWCWNGKDTSNARIFVLNVPDGRVLAERLVSERVMGIRRSAGAFDALLRSGVWTSIAAPVAK
jgi:WD40 repeat protein